MRRPYCLLGRAIYSYKLFCQAPPIALIGYHWHVDLYLLMWYWWIALSSLWPLVSVSLYHTRLIEWGLPAASVSFLQRICNHFFKYYVISTVCSYFSQVFQSHWLTYIYHAPLKLITSKIPLSKHVKARVYPFHI